MRLEGLPKTATAATCSATFSGSGSPNPNAACPGTVMRSMPAAPCEYPSSTSLACGHDEAVLSTNCLASFAPSSAEEIVGRWVVDSIAGHGLAVDKGAQRVDKCLPDASRTGWFVGAPRKHHLDVRA